MTWLGRIMTFVPFVLLAGIVISFFHLLVHPSFNSAIAAILITYGIPVLLYRVHNLIFPLKYGLVSISEPYYSSWWGGHQLQLIYALFPSFERLLRLIPGAYSAWLRLWGSSIGRGVYWTPQVQVHDRGLMIIGDRVVFGHQVQCFCHVISPRNGYMALFTKPIKIGDGAFIGAGSNLGPGVSIAAGAIVGTCSHLSVNRRYGSQGCNQ